MLYVYFTDGSLQIFKTSDIDKLLKEDFHGALYIPAQLSQNQTSSVTDQRVLIASQSNYIQLLLPGSLGILSLESTYSAKIDKDSSGFDISWVRYIMIFGAITCVGGYQWYKWKKQDNLKYQAAAQEKLLSKQAGFQQDKGGKQKPQAAQMDEIQRMMA